MAFLMIMEWPGVTREQYEAVRADVDWVSNPPEGVLLHASAFNDSGMRVVDLWDNPQQFQDFFSTRIQEAVARAGLQGEPNVQMVEAAYIDQLGIKRMA